MPSTLTALFATALHEAKVADAEPIGLQRAAALLVTAAGARRIEWQVDGDHLGVNGFPLRRGSPGASLLVESLDQHLTRRLALPAGLTAAQWIDLAQLYAAAPGIYPTAEHMRVAITAIVPGAGFEASAEQVSESATSGSGSAGRPAMSAFADAVDPGDPALVSRETDLSEFSGRIDPIIDAAHKAVARADWFRVAQLLVELDAIASESDASRAIVTQERRRILPELAIEHLVAELPTASQSEIVIQAIDSLGNDGAEAIFELLAHQPPRPRHRLYLEVLAGMRYADDAIVTALGSDSDLVAADAATVVGRRRMERAVPVLGALLGHGNSEVRTAAWRALEDIGSPEALALIR